ncbi:MAG TPA: SgcJ/EcaC family oxidoreductase [Gaiellaceae bacterium]
MTEAHVSAIVDEFEAAWNAHDMRRFAACFADDAEFVNVAGMWWRGREEIEQKHVAAHAAGLKDSTMRAQLAAFKEIGPSIGLAHVTWELDGHDQSGSARIADTRRGVMSWTVRDRQGTVEIVSAHNTDTLAPPSD